MRHPSVRTLSIVTASTFGLAGLSAATCLFWVAAEVGRATSVVQRDTESQDLVRALELDLLNYHRTSNMAVAWKSPELEPRRSAFETRMRRNLVVTCNDPATAEERELCQQATGLINGFFAERKRAEATGRAVPELVKMVEPSLEAAVSSLTLLRKFHKEQVQRAHTRALGSAWASQVMAMWVAGIVLAGALAVILGIGAYVVKPLSELRDTMKRHRSGESDARASTRGPPEVVDIASAFNEMSDALASQTRDQATFLAGVAHDIKNPLSVLKVSVQVLHQEVAVNERARRMLSLIDRQFDSLARIVNDMLDASRIRAGELELQVENVDLRTAVGEIVDMYSPVCPAHQLLLHTPPEPVVARADYQRMQQVLANLINNAIKYSPDGGPVDITVQSRDGEAVVSVSDHGIGILPELIPEIFRPFHRQQRARNTAAGVGLGLSVVRRIVEAHGGRIDVESTPRVGSTFRIRIPLAAEQATR